MKQEDKELLLKDLSARLSYKCKYKASKKITHWHKLTLSTGTIDKIIDEYYDEIKPYLRPLSSMTSQEWCELCDCDTEDEKAAIYLKDGRRFVSHVNKETFLNSHHFDYRGLIEKGLALEAPEGMYK